VFVNVFGGITSCDAVANGIVQAFDLLAERGESVNKPLVVRLDGNNAELGRQILADAALPGVEPVDNMDDAADRAAELVVCRSFSWLLAGGRRGRVRPWRGCPRRWRSTRTVSGWCCGR